MKQSGTSVSHVIEYFSLLYSTRNEWISNPEARDSITNDLNNFDANTHGVYWLTDREEQLLDTIATLIEVYI